MAEWSVDVAVVAEPYFVPDQPNWVGDRNGSVAVIVRASPGFTPPSLLEGGSGYVVAEWGDLVVIGTYFSPNRPLVEFDILLGVIGAAVRRAAPRQVLLLEDLNAKSVVWGNPATTARGHAFELWAAAVGLSILNRGSVHTCVRRQGGSIVDLSLATTALARRVAIGG
jgi:hypothetical protein